MSGAIYHHSVKVIGRSGGHSATAAAAYRAGQEIADQRTGEVHDYTRKQHVAWSEIVAPSNAPAWARDRAELWNQVELAEKRKDAQLCREINVALPHVLTADQQKNLLREYAQGFADQGMIADVTRHDKPDNNHGHVMLTMRDVGPEGFGKKNREWNDRQQIAAWREQWATVANKHLALAGRPERIDHRSLQAQGIDRQPQIHVGPTATAMDRRGLQADRAEINRAIINYNGQVATLKAQPPADRFDRQAAAAKASVEQDYKWLLDPGKVAAKAHIEIRSGEIEQIRERIDKAKRAQDQADAALAKRQAELDQLRFWQRGPRRELTGKIEQIEQRQQQIASAQGGMESRLRELQKPVPAEQLESFKEKYEQKRQGELASCEKWAVEARKADKEKQERMQRNKEERLRVVQEARERDRLTEMAARGREKVQAQKPVKKASGDRLTEMSARARENQEPAAQGLVERLKGNREQKPTPAQQAQQDERRQIQAEGRRIEEEQKQQAKSRGPCLGG